MAEGTTPDTPELETGREQDKSAYRWPISVYSNVPPAKYVVWPMDRQGNWLEKVEIDIPRPI